MNMPSGSLLGKNEIMGELALPDWKKSTKQPDPLVKLTGCGACALLPFLTTSSGRNGHLGNGAQTRRVHSALKKVL